MNTSLAVAAVIFVMVLGLGAGYLGGTVNSATTTVTSISTRTSSSTSTVTQSITTTLTQSVTKTVTQSPTASPSGGDVANLVVVPDWGGATYDAFVRASNVNATGPVFATNSSAPGRSDNNVTASVGVPVKFVITNLDTAVLMNFTDSVKTPFSFYNFTDAGAVAQQFQTGQVVANLAISHTFTISELGLNIPIPPGTIVTFTYAFTKPGVYAYFCKTPCGPGMTVAGYMIGYVIVS